MANDKSFGTLVHLVSCLHHLFAFAKVQMPGFLLLMIMLFLSDDFADPVEQDELKSQLMMFSRLSSLQVCCVLSRLEMLIKILGI